MIDQEWRKLWLRENEAERARQVYNDYFRRDFGGLPLSTLAANVEETEARVYTQRKKIKAMICAEERIT